jgi:hypothetical protein
MVAHDFAISLAANLGEAAIHRIGHHLVHLGGEKLMLTLAPSLPGNLHGSQGLTHGAPAVKSCRVGKALPGLRS